MGANQENWKKELSEVLIISIYSIFSYLGIGKQMGQIGHEH